MDKKVIIGVIIGVVIGLPQGLNSTPITDSPFIPVKTILVASSITLLFCMFMGMSMIRERKKKKIFIGKYFDLYSCFLVGTLCIGIPVFILNVPIDWQSSLLLSGYFFTSAGLGLIFGGLVANVTKRT